MSKDLVSKWFSKISQQEQNLPLLVYNGMGYTPRQTYDEVMRGTATGSALQSLIERGTYGTSTADEKEIIKARFRIRLQQQDPNRMIFVALPSSGLGPKTYTASQLLQEIENETDIGKSWMSAESEHMKAILAVR